MKVPWTPEPIDRLRARYLLAIATLNDQLDVAAGYCPAPSSDPAHVFDTQLGLRLIVSRDRWEDGRVGIHVSASWNRPLSGRENVDSLYAEITAIWQAISGSSSRLVLEDVSDGGVPHFRVEPVN